MFCYIFSLTHHFLSYFLSSATLLENKKWRKPFGFLLPPSPAFKNSWWLAWRLERGFGDMFPENILNRNSEMLCVLVLILTKYMVQYVECYLLIISSSLFSKHVNLHTKNKHTLLNIENHRISPIKTIWRYGSFLD